MSLNDKAKQKFHYSKPLPKKIGPSFVDQPDAFTDKVCFGTMKMRDEYLIEEAKNCILSDIQRLQARIGKGPTVAFLLDEFIDKIKPLKE